MLTELVVTPLAFAALTFLVPSNRLRPWLLPLGAALQLTLVCRQVFVTGYSQTLYAYDRWLALDPLGCLFLVLVTSLFFLCAAYAPGYLSQRIERNNRVLCACLFLSLGMMTLIILSHHLGLMWVAMEATTLSTAPGIYFNHNARSLEATWKYLLICSVGIALALFGSLILAYSTFHSHLETTLLFDDLLRDAPQLSSEWLRAAFVMLLVGYGTKMGLAPIHTWKPDTYGEAPGMVGALMAGGMTSCAFLAILRFYQIMVAAGKLDYVQPVLIFMGVLSMLFAAAFMARQKDFKRMLAYSSVEHMGILVLGIGLGGKGVYYALFHAINNGLTKVVLFLSAGNIHRAYGSKFVGDVQGASRRLPLSGWAFLFGFLAITGSPPFSPFVSQLGIVATAFTTKHYYAAALFLAALLLVFLAFGSAVINMVFGRPSAPPSLTRFHDHFSTSWPIVVALAAVLTLGVAMPGRINGLLVAASEYLDHPGVRNPSDERDGAAPSAAPGKPTGSPPTSETKSPVSESPESPPRQ